MTEKIMPVDLVQKSFALVERTHQSLSARDLPKRIALKRNAVAVAMLPEAFTILQAATSSFKLRVFLWILAGLAIVLSPLLTWWLLVISATVIIIERIIAIRERQFWILLASMLLSAEMLMSDFAGWGTAYPNARSAVTTALGTSVNGTIIFEWLDYYLPQREEIEEELLIAFGPIVR
ncbi:MAG: hypothetical protein ACYC7E_20590 [Armatimonadota bacterium]